MVDAVGALIQIHNVHPRTKVPLTVSTVLNDQECVYTGNVLSDAQFFVGKAVLNGELSGTKGNVNELAIDWAEGRIDTLADLIAELSFGGNSGYICNGDSMAHVNKGLIGFKIDGTKKAIMENCFVQRSMNLGGPGSPLCGAYYNVSVPGSMHPGYNGANTRGFSVAGSRSVIVR